LLGISTARGSRVKPSSNCVTPLTASQTRLISPRNTEPRIAPRNTRTGALFASCISSNTSACHHASLQIGDQVETGEPPDRNLRVMRPTLRVSAGVLWCPQATGSSRFRQRSCPSVASRHPWYPCWRLQIVCRATADDREPRSPTLNTPGMTCFVKRPGHPRGHSYTGNAATVCSLRSSRR